MARAHAGGRLRLVDAANRAAREAWRQVDRAAVHASWMLLLPTVLTALVAAQRGAARMADAYLDRVLTAQGIDTASRGQVNPRAFAGAASDGRRLDALLAAPVVTTLGALRAGATAARAMASGQATLEMIVGTQVADAGRVADQVAMVSHPAVSGYVRMLTPPSCSRCAILAGRRYRYNAGFQRHPNCNCVHVPTREDRADDIRTDPRGYFDSLSPEEQDRLFTKAGAEAIRLGSDPAQVVNARRGMSAAGFTQRPYHAAGRMRPETVFGREAFITREGMTRHGVAGARLGGRSAGVRLMPEQILRDATSREDAQRLLERFGYII